MRKRLTTALISVILAVTVALVLTACEPNDGRSENPDYHYGADGKIITFTLELREPSEKSETESTDRFPHSELDGKLIKSWDIPMYGNTVYESVVKYFEDKTESVTFRLENRKFYMFHDLTLDDGTTYNLETVYMAVDGVYASCANFQSILGSDGEGSTDDDIKKVVLVYRGWLY